MTLRNDSADPVQRSGRIAIGIAIAIPALLIVIAALAVTMILDGNSEPIRESDVEGTWVDGGSVVLVLRSDGSAEVSGLKGQSATGVTDVVSGIGTWRLASSDSVQISLGTEADRMYVDLHAERQWGAVKLIAFSGDPDDPRSARVFDSRSDTGSR